MLEPGDAVDVWVVDRALGRGGMGSVYRCHNRNATRILAAVKVLELPVRRHPDTTARFVREAEILFGLDHPNIVKVRNIRTEHEPPYLEMEFVEGESLEDALERGPIPGDKGLDIIRQCAKAVQYLHQKGIRHRDIKPANFLVRKDGRVKLVDFGLALEQDMSRITQAGMAFGTVSYAPPEWANPENLDPIKWDLYALGIVMYEILTGEVAFPVSGQGSARQQAMQVVLSKQGHSPLDPGEEHPHPLRALIAELTRSDPDERLSDASEVLRRLGIELRSNDWDTTSEEDHPSVITTMPTPGVPIQRRAAPDTWKGEEGTLASHTQGGGSGLSRWLLAAAVLMVLGGGAALALAMAGGFAWYASAPTERDVEVVLIGITAETPHEVALDRTPADRSEPPNHSFDGIGHGHHQVAWVVGEGCVLAGCLEGDCPPTCHHRVETVEVSSGEGRQTLNINVPAPTPRAVRLPLPDLPKEVSVSVTVASEPTTDVAGGVKTAPLRPGTHAVRLAIGTCPADQQACAEDCPEDCIVVATDVVVPWSGAPEPPAWPSDLPKRWVTRAIEEPEPAPAPQPSPRPEPKPKPSAAGPLVTQAQLATWLEGPGGIYQPGAPKGYKGIGHLDGWKGATAPSPSDVVVGIAFPAARDYCGSKGVPTLADAVVGKAAYEWRVDAEGKPVVVARGSTEGLPAGRGTGQFVAQASFRCRR